MYNSGKVKRLFGSQNINKETYIICEIGVNHNGSLDTAIQLIEEAKKANVDAVKFQKRNLENIYSSYILQDSNSAEWNFEYLIPLLKELELSKDDYYKIRDKCDELEIDLIITPFDEESVEFIANLGITAFKISSADMTNFNLIKKCARYSLPIIISTGMWEEEDIQKCANLFKSLDIDFALLHAQSTYPSPYESLNLQFVDKLKKYTNIVGYSGHERGTFIPVAAVSMGCNIIEKHITLDKNQNGPDHKASMTPDEWSKMVHDIRMLEKALKPDKVVNQAEKLNKELFAKSAIAVKPLKKGHILKKEDVLFKAPGKGIFPHEIDGYFGKVLKNDIPQEKYISKGDFEEIINISNWKKFNFSKHWGVKCRFHDFDEYVSLNSPMVEFHFSQTDLEYTFKPQKEYCNQLIVHAPEIFDRELVDICSNNIEKVDRSLKILQQTIDKTLEMSKYFPARTPKIVAHLGGMSVNENNHYDYLESLERAKRNFEKLDIPLNELEFLPENLPHRPWYLGGQWYQYGFMRAEDMIDFCKHFNIGMTYDVCHAFLYCKAFDKDIVEYTKQVMPYVRHVHISDAEGISGEGLQVGEGEVDFEKVFAAMSGYDFSWLTEIWSGHLYQGTGTYTALKSLEKYNHIL